MKLADLVAMLALEEPPVRFTAYDGSSFGRADAPVTLELATERGLRYLATAPGDLGLVRAYVAGDLLLHGAPPGDPYPALKLLGNWRFRRPSAKELTTLLPALGWRNLIPPPPPPQ